MLIDEVLHAFGRLDVWVCSSGLLGPPSIHDTTPSDLQRCFEAHSMAPFFALKYAPPAMAKLTKKLLYPNAAPKSQKYGSIIVISSVASTYGGCWGPSYTMATHAALGVVRAGVAVLKGSGVRINCISPGQVDVGVDLHGVSSWYQRCVFPSKLLRYFHTDGHERPYGAVPTSIVTNTRGQDPNIVTSIWLVLLTILDARDPGPEADDPTRACWTTKGGRESRWVPRLWILVLRQWGKYGGRRRGKCDEPYDNPNLSGILDLNMP